MLKLKHLSKQYDDVVLNDISICFPATGLIVIVGESGCGKSTLLHILGGIDQHYSGKILLNRKNIKSEKNYIRNHVGFVFQNMYLIDEMTVKENYMLSAFFKKIEISKEKRYLKKLKIEMLADEKAAVLSGGEKQRAAIMRAFMSGNDLILCDEPTGSLDEANSETVFSLLRELAKEKLVIAVSHDMVLARKYSDHLYRLDHGKLILMKKRKSFRKYAEKKGKQKPFAFLIVKLFKLSWRSHLLMIQVIFVAILSILLAFSLAEASHQQIQKTIEQFIPSTTILCQRKDGQNITVKELDSIHKDYIVYRCMEYTDIELLGLSFDETLTENDLFYISDYSQRAKGDLLMGKNIKNDHDMLVSQNTYEALCQHFQKENMLNEKLRLYLKNGQKTAAVTVDIVGVTCQETPLHTVYLKEFAYSNFCQELFSVKEGELFFVQTEKSDDIDRLKKDYPLYQFQIANAGLTSSIDEKMDQLQKILFGFSLMIIISSCFLLGEVFYLNVIKRKKMFAVFKSLGASAIQVSLLVLSQGVIIVICAFIEATLLLNNLLQLFNGLIEQYITDQGEHIFTLNMQMVMTVFLFSLMLTAVSCMIPVYKASHIDIIDGLKG